ncbi:unnamed protein product [Hermetia illucens]|uniref:PiggyBac transposable element-derived protein domain-containing protein n=1 Tax=Hermetia illucens TaxID=343691 RepID=A0A7R8UDJ1_HERIL|nr:unnamed protein product [Hermetia illucens]
MFGHQKDVSVVSYAPKKNKVVILMTNLHHDDKINSATEDQKKPEIIIFFNSTKVRLDVDELCGSYNVSRNSKRWVMTIYYGMLNIAAVNVNIIFRENQGEDTKRTDFIRNLDLA